MSVCVCAVCIRAIDLFTIPTQVASHTPPISILRHKVHGRPQSYEYDYNYYKQGLKSIFGSTPTTGMHYKHINKSLLVVMATRGTGSVPSLLVLFRCDLTTT